MRQQTIAKSLPAKAGSTFPEHSVRHEGQSVRPEEQSVRHERQSVRPEGKSARPEVQSVRPEGQSMRPDGKSVRPEGQSVGDTNIIGDPTLGGVTPNGKTGSV